MKTILCYGDSNTWGYDVQTYDPVLDCCKRMDFDKRWPGVVQGRLGAGYRVIEDALNSRTCVNDDPYFPMRNGYNSLIQALDSNAPLDLVILQMGVNELKHMFNLTAGMIAFGFERLVTAAKTSSYGYAPPKILVIAPAPVTPNIGQLLYGFSYGPLAYEKSVQLGPLYREIAKRHGCGFIDCAELGFEINNVDGIHYSVQDHRKLANAVTEQVLRLIG